MISFAQAILRTTTTIIARSLTLQKAIQKGAGNLGSFFLKK